MELKSMYEAHVRDDFVLSRKQLEIMAMVCEASSFMMLHQKRYVFVDGDKGKMLGFLSRKEYSGLCDDFLRAAIAEGKFSRGVAYMLFISEHLAFVCRCFHMFLS